MPRTVVDPAVIERAVTIAARSPSLHNSQPWIWVVEGPELQLYLDRSRIVRYTDASGREALISCGAMLDHLRLAMAATGWRSVVQRFPNPNNFTHIASVDFRPGGEVDTATAARANAILRRRTDRLPFLPPPDWHTVESALRALLQTGDVRLDVIDEQLRGELAEASSLTEAMRRRDPAYISELDWWTAPFELDEGIPRSALNSVAEADQVSINRSFPSAGHSRRRVSVGPDRAKVVVLSTPSNTRDDALAAGEALSTVLLECTAAGLATCTVTHLTELDAGRALIGELLGSDAHPQVLIRIGRAPALEQLPAPTPRRALSDILRIRQ